MLAQIKRRMVVLASVAVTLAFFALPGVASAEGEHSVVRPGVYEGLWHGDNVQIIIDKVNRDGTFSGEIHFDPNGRWGDVRSEFTARLGKHDELTMSRPDSAQISESREPRLDGRMLVWKGTTLLQDNTRHPFELRIPVRR